MSDAGDPSGSPAARRGEIVSSEPAEYEIRGEIQQVQYRSSPYPDPSEMGQYEKILPGWTDRILTLTERESEHRIQQERLQTRATIELAKRGQFFAFIIVLALVAVGGAGIITGHSIVGLAGIITAAATVVGAFISPKIFRRLHGGTQGELPADTGAG